MKLGDHGAITPEQARTLARKAQGEIASGDDPSAERQRQRRAPTVAALCDRYLNEYVAVRLKPRTQTECRRACVKYITPAMGSARVEAVTRSDVAALHHQLRDKPTQANRVREVLSKMFNLAELWGLRPDGSNPTRHVKKYPERPRNRFLSLDEIETLLRTLDQRVARNEETSHVAGAFKLLLFTGCRLSEIQFLKWAYIRGDQIFLPDAKTGPRPVQLPDSALEILASLPRDPNNPFVIIGAVPGQAVTDLQKPWRRIRTEAGLDDVRIHDLRHTFASLAAMSGQSLPMIGRLLGHTQPQTTQRYAHLATEPVRKAAAEIDSIFRGVSSKPRRPNFSLIKND